MGLAAIAAAAEVAAAAAAEKQRVLSSSSGPSAGSSSRSRSLLSDSTDADDQCESDSSLPSSGHASPDASAKKNMPGTHAQGKSSKKRRAEAALKQQHKKVAAEPVDTFPAEMLLDLAGSTSAEVRRMNDDERALVHYKRRLRNRESAKRSRARRQATISDIQVELEDLREVTASLLDRCVSFARTNDRQSQELETLRKEKQLLESMLREGGGSIL